MLRRYASEKFTCFCVFLPSTSLYIVIMEKAPVRNLKKELLSDNWYTLNKFTFEYEKKDGELEKQEREVYDCGDAIAILLYNKKNKTVILTKQFRLPVYRNEKGTGMMIEVCAGLLDGDTPEVCAKRETLEETGYHIDEVKKIFEAYMVPGPVTQKVHFFIAEYTHEMRVTLGGGAEHETENIEVLEFNFEAALKMIETREIRDGKTIMLLQYAKINNVF